MITSWLQANLMLFRLIWCTTIMTSFRIGITVFVSVIYPLYVGSICRTSRLRPARSSLVVAIHRRLGRPFLLFPCTSIPTSFSPGIPTHNMSNHLSSHVQTTTTFVPALSLIFLSLWADNSDGMRWNSKQQQKQTQSRGCPQLAIIKTQSKIITITLFWLRW